MNTSNKYKNIKKAAKIENYPNLNIYNLDSDYKMMKNLCFEQEHDEATCMRNIIMRYVGYLHILIIISILKNTILLLDDYAYLARFYIILRIVSLISLTFELIFVSNIQKFINNPLYLRWVLEIDTLINIFISCKRNTDLPLYSIFFQLICTFIYNCIFNLNFTNSSIFISLETLIFLMFIGYIEENFILRFFYNILSIRGQYVFFYAILTGFIQYLLLKSQREIWALYDSFKRSYFVLKNICDEIPFPVFVINIKKQIQNNSQVFIYQTYYKNNEAEKHLKLIETEKFKNSNKLNKEDCKIKKIISNKKINCFKDFFEKSVEKLLDNEIDKCLQNECSHFDFPWIIGNNILNFKLNENLPTLYEGELHKIKWVRIYISPTTWKGLDCLMIQILENNDLQFNYFMENYLSSINNEFRNTLDNLDIICNGTPEMKSNNDKKILQLNQNKLEKQPFNYDRIKTPEVRNRELSYKNSVSLPKEGCSPINKQIIRSETNSKFYQLSKKFDQNPLNIYLKTQTSVIKKPDFDYSLLYLMKNSLNCIYDMNHTTYTLQSLRLSKIHTELTQFHFENLINYLIKNLLPFLKLKNLSVKLFSNIQEINAIYEYYRLIFFNTLLFIINNSNKKETEQIIEIHVEHSRYADQGASSIYDVDIIFNDENPKISYSLISQFISNFYGVQLQNSYFERYEIIDIGLFLSSFIVNNIYSSEYKITSDKINHKINFLISSHDIAGTELKNKLLNSSTLEEKYIEKITNFFIINSKPNSNPINKISIDPLPEKVTRSNNRHNTGNRTYLKIYMDDSEQEEFFPLESDRKKYNNLRLKMNKCFENNEKLLTLTDNILKLNEIKENSKRIKKNKVIYPQTEKIYVKWDDSSIIHHIKYCTFPRFLIVEVIYFYFIIKDNNFGRISIKDELKKLKLEHRYDMCDDGREAVHKFKILLNQGYTFDFIFMDINLRDMGGVEATKNIRDLESTYNIHTNIVAITVEGKNHFEGELFDEYSKINF